MNLYLGCGGGGRGGDDSKNLIEIDKHCQSNSASPRLANLAVFSLRWKLLNSESDNIQGLLDKINVDHL